MQLTTSLTSERSKMLNTHNEHRLTQQVADGAWPCTMSLGGEKKKATYVAICLIEQPNLLSKNLSRFF
jgi:hypothetical protein